MQRISSLLRKDSFDKACNFANHIKIYFSPLKTFLQKNIKKDLEKYTSNVLLNDGSLFLWMLFKTRFPDLKLTRRIVNDKLQIYLNSTKIIVSCDCEMIDCDVNKTLSYGEKDLRFWIMNFTDIDFKLVEKLVKVYDIMQTFPEDGIVGDFTTSTPLEKMSIFDKLGNMEVSNL